MDQTPEEQVEDILDGWFGEPVAHAEDEDQKRKYLYDPLIKLVNSLTNIEKSV